MSKDMRYRSLHHHSTFSYLDGFGLPDAHVRRAAELQMPGLALTDHGNISGHVKLEQAAVKEGIKPIFGCELYTGGIDEETRTQKKNHLTVIAENLEGYHNLMRLVSQSFKDFYYAPTVSGRTLSAHKNGLVVLSGCRGSLLACTAIGGKNTAEADASFQRASKMARRFKQTFGDAFYLEVQAFPELEDICRLNPFYEELSQKLGIPLVATGDVHYTKPDENEMQIILHNVRGANKLTYEDQARSWGYDVPLCPPVDDNVMYKRLRGTGLSKQAAIDAILNTEQIAERCTVELPKMENIRFPIPKGYKDRQEVWQAWIKEGWAYRGIEEMPNRNDYVRRLKHELQVVEGKDFVDYFLVVSDIVKFAKNNAIPVGPGRGSAAASLICYLLRITEVDPLKFPNLVFERFIDVTRKELPDIDLDFDDERRYLIKEYAGQKYGADRVGNIGTFTTYKAKNTLDDIGRVFDIPKWEIEQIKGLMLDRSSGDLRYSETIEDTVLSNPDAKATFEKYPDLWKATKLEGNVRGMGMHAAGFVISNYPITEVCAVYSREDSKGNITEVISADKHDAKYLGALKLDLLGLKTMGMLRYALEELNMTLQDMYDLPLDDPETIDAFRRNDVVGIFQFEGRATKSVNEEVKPDNFLEICDVNALSRPGPLHSGASVAYVDAKFGSEPDSVHPALDDITKNAHGQIIYQEQILRIIREIGAFDWTEHEYIRKIIGQRMGKQEFSRQWEKFWAGAQKIMDEATAQKIWGHCITAGAYAFNYAHCCSYSMIAYWQMWLKVHHPLVFFTSQLIRANDEKRLSYIQDAIKHGISIQPPDMNASGVDWDYDPEQNRIMAGFISIPTIGAAKAKVIVDTRWDMDGFESWDDLLKVKGIGQKTIVTIKKFVEDKDPFRIYWMKERIEGIRRQIIKKEFGPLPLPSHDAAEVPQSKGRDQPVVWLGLVKHRNLRELFEINNKRGTPLDPSEVKDPHLNEWVIMTGIDDTEMLSITIDRWKYPVFKKAIWDIKQENDIVLVRGVKKGWMSWRAIYAEEMWVFEGDSEDNDPYLEEAF